MPTTRSALAFSCFFIGRALAQLNGTSPFVDAIDTAGNSTNVTAPFWLEEIKHQGRVAFGDDSTYKVFRNVRDFGAKGQSTFLIAIVCLTEYSQGMELPTTQKPLIWLSTAAAAVVLGLVNPLPQLQLSSTFHQEFIASPCQY